MRRPDLDERFIQAVQAEFPNVVNRQHLPFDAPPNAPHITLTSTSSQLLFSALQADFQVGFYGDYLQDAAKCLEYIGTKVRAMHAGLTAIGQTPANLGAIITMQYSFHELPVTPAEHILATHLRADLDPRDVQDAMGRVAIRVRDTYFLNLHVKNYEARTLHRPIMPGLPQAITIKPWEGTVEDVGVELTVDINNNLAGRVRRADPQVEIADVDALLEALESAVNLVAPEYVAHGRVPMQDRSA